MISIDRLSLSYGDKCVVKDISMAISEREVTTIIGPNGCGKSTLLKAISKNMSYKRGSIQVMNQDLKKYKRSGLAKCLAILPQAPVAPKDISVGELVGFGRYPFIPFGKRMTHHDRQVIDEALMKTGMKHMRCKKLGQLSGGERQRAWIAMALAQEPSILILDEPTTYLDIAHQYETLELIRRLCKEMSMTILMVLHDINQAARYSDHLIVMKEGRKYCNGSPEEVLKKHIIQEVFGVTGEISHHENHPYFIFRGEEQ